MRKTRFWDRALLLGAAGALLFGCVGLSLFPAPRYSITEKRNLAAFPTPTMAGALDGTLTAALEDYAAERVPFRSLCREGWSTLQLLLLRGESHGVILCRDGSLCRRLAINEGVYRQNLAALPKLQAALGDLPLTVAVAPRRIDVRSEVLPALYSTARDLEVWQALPAGVITFLDATQDSQWYRTDHHWTSEGAYFAYVRLSRSLGFTPLPENVFSKEVVTESFLGSSAAAAGFPFITPDTVSVWHYPGDEGYRVLRDGTLAAFVGLYDTQKIGSGDEYSLFLGGNCGLLQIDRGEEDTRPLLLVIKDSFANSLLPFLAQHYRILAVDPRYRGERIRDLAENADRVLLLCGMQTLTEAPFLSPLLR